MNIDRIADIDYHRPSDTVFVYVADDTGHLHVLNLDGAEVPDLITKLQDVEKQRNVP